MGEPGSRSVGSANFGRYRLCLLLCKRATHVHVGGRLTCGSEIPSMISVFHRTTFGSPAFARAILSFVVTIALGSCAQILTPVPPKAPADPQDYSWTKPALATGIEFYVLRQN